MKSIPAALLAHIGSDVTTLATCWLIELADGTNVRGTDHDRAIPIAEVPTGINDDLVGTYSAVTNISGSDVHGSADLSVDNMEVDGALSTNPADVDLTVERVESGVADRAPVWVFLVNWMAPDTGVIILRRGYLGEFTRTSDGAYKTEIRGLGQLLSQTIGGTFGERCSVKRLGDAQCKLDIAPLTRTGVVTAVTGRSAFTVSVTPSTEPVRDSFFSLGIIAFTSGANNGFEREVKRAPFSSGGVLDVELWDEAPADVQVGDTLTIEPGCDRLFLTCTGNFDNGINFRGYGYLIPGIDALTKGPTIS